LSFDSVEQRKKAEKILMEKEDREIEAKLLLVSKDIKKQKKNYLVSN
jgi:hypothetical protein